MVFGDCYVPVCVCVCRVVHGIDANEWVRKWKCGTWAVCIWCNEILSSCRMYFIENNDNRSLSFSDHFVHPYSTSIVCTTVYSMHSAMSMTTTDRKHTQHNAHTHTTINAKNCCTQFRSLFTFFNLGSQSISNVEAFEWMHVDVMNEWHFRM